MDYVDIARRWTDAGFLVVAARIEDKRPHGEWKHLERTAPHLLERWPTGAGIGILTKLSGLVVVDLDVKTKGPDGQPVDGISNWAALLQRLGLPNFPPHETTPSGGKHIYFYADDNHPLSNSVSRKLGIDVRGGSAAKMGGFIVSAPTPGYESTAGFSPETLPDNIYTMPEILKHYFSTKAHSTNSPAHRARVIVASEDPVKAAEKLVTRFREGDIPGGLGAGNRNVGLHWIACRLWEIDALHPGIADDHYDEIVDILEAIPGDPMDREEISATWRSARRSAEDSPLALPGEMQDRPNTDLGNAKRLRDYLDRKGTPAHYTPEAGYLLWDGKRWHRDALNVVRTAAQHVAEETKQNAALDTERAKGTGEVDLIERAKAAQKWASYSQSSVGLSAMMAQFQYLPGISVSLADFDVSPELLNVANGTVDLRTGDLRPHDPADKLTKLIKYEYHPEATAERWLQFLGEVFKDKDMPAYYQRLIGYGITGEVTEQCLAICHGTGANGKSVAADVLAHVFDEYVHITDFSTFEDGRTGAGASPQIVALRGARLVFASEGTAGAPMAEATVKKLTGSERITARDLYKSPVTFLPTALIILSTNHKPLIKGQDDGVWRRIKSIAWPVQFNKETRDTGLVTRLKVTEAEGILAWAVAGARDWYMHGLEDPESVQEATMEYRVNQDMLSEFLPGVLVRDENSRVDLKDAYAWYLDWAREMGLQQRDVVSKQTLKRMLDERKVPTVIGHARKRYLVGVRKATESDSIRLELG